jgi:lysozyme family protein
MPCIAPVLDRIMRREGGWSDHPDDRGGQTNYGVTLWTLRSVEPDATEDDLRALSQDEAKQILHTIYWMEAKFDRLTVAPQVAELLLDTAVHSGAPNATKMLQRALGVKADGLIGPATAAAAFEVPQNQLMAELVSERMAFLFRLVQMDPSQGSFAVGWGNRLREFISAIPEVGA